MWKENFHYLLPKSLGKKSLVPSVRSAFYLLGIVRNAWTFTAVTEKSWALLSNYEVGGIHARRELVCLAVSVSISSEDFPFCLKDRLCDDVSKTSWKRIKEYPLPPQDVKDCAEGWVWHCFAIFVYYYFADINFNLTFNRGCKGYKIYLTVI